jgi:reactive intermediate/imine deaminase
MSREALSPPGFRPAGPYSAAVIASGRLLFVSSQGPVDHATGQRLDGPVQDAARQALSNIRMIVEHAGGSLQNAVKVQLFLRDMADFAAVNEVYAEFFPEPRPARTTIQSNIAYPLAVDVVVALDE